MSTLNKKYAAAGDRLRLLAYHLSRENFKHNFTV